MGVVRNAQDEILIALRHSDSHQGGLWEFPGGKVEANEDVVGALSRELAEETGLHVLSAQPLMKINHDYTDKSVLLDVWEVLDYRGEPFGREGQTIQWCPPESLQADKFPLANVPIIQRLQLGF